MDNRENTNSLFKFSTLAFILLFCLKFSIQGEAGEFPYECQAGEEFYQHIMRAYTKAQDGSEDKILVGLQEWFDQGCLWQFNDVQPKLKDLFSKMLLDPRLHESSTINASVLYIMTAGPDDFIIELSDKMTDKARRSVVITILNRYDRRFNNVEFLKKQIVREPDLEFKKQFIGNFGARYIPNFSEIKEFCEPNQIPLDLSILLTYPQLSALDYLFQHKEMLSEKIKYYSGQSRHFSSLSSYIRTVLGRHLETGFTQGYLEHLTSKDLRLLRNSIFATYGKNFKSKILQHYFYGEYPNVKDYCRDGQCGLGPRLKGQFRESDLTEIDKRNIDELVKSPILPFFVIPVKTGIQVFQAVV